MDERLVRGIRLSVAWRSAYTGWIATMALRRYGRRGCISVPGWLLVPTMVAIRRIVIVGSHGAGGLVGRKTSRPVVPMAAGARGVLSPRGMASAGLGLFLDFFAQDATAGGVATLWRRTRGAVVAARRGLSRARRGIGGFDVVFFGAQIGPAV